MRDIVLRDYQYAAIRATLESLKKKKRPVVVLPTGAGKSIISRELTLKDGNTLILCPSRELVDQNADKYSFEVTKWYAGARKSAFSRVTISTFSSLKNRLKRNSICFDRVIVDEAHGIGRGTVVGRILDKWECPIIGLTATPYRTDSGIIYGDNDQSFFSNKAYEVSRMSLVLSGYLSKRQYSGISKNNILDTTGVSISRGDYDTQALSEKCADPSIKIAKSLQHLNRAIFFCIDKEHARRVHEALPQSKYVYADMNTKERRETISLFKKGTIRSLVNIACLTTGFDYPDLRHIVILRPTKSLVLYNQILGRGDRIAEGKSECLIHDYTNNFETLVACSDSLKSSNTLDSCPYCKMITDYAKAYCTHCNQKIRDKRSKDTIDSMCNNCGNCVSVRATYCNNCGHYVGKSNDKEYSENSIVLKSFRIMKASIDDGWQILLNKNEDLILNFSHEDVKCGGVRQLFEAIGQNIIDDIVNSKKQKNYIFKKPVLRLFVSRSFENTLVLDGFKKGNQ